MPIIATGPHVTLMRYRQTQARPARRDDSMTRTIGLSASAVAYSGGDDLIRARKFSTAARSQMTAIIEADRSNGRSAALAKGRDPVWLCERLDAIQRDAKRARARAVYRSAQDVMSLIERRNAHMPIDWTRVDGRLFVLNKLLGQYEDGVDELETMLIDDTAERPNEEIIDFDPVQALAKQTLTTLLPFARGDERHALTRLMDADTQPQQMDTPEQAPIEPEPINSATVQTEGLDGLSLEWIMADLVQRLLCVGREYGKVLSVSHSLDDVRVAEGTLSEVDARLFDALSNVIASDLPLQGVGRIDIGPALSGLNVSGSGFADFEIALPERVETNTPEFAHEGTASDLSRTSATHRRRITDETEDDLRAQLAALMDGGLQDRGQGS